MNKEIIDLLEKANEGTTLLPHKAYYRVNPDKYNQVLTLLKQQPIAEAIKKELLEACEKLLKMCDRLDVHDVGCATQAAGVADEFAAMGCTCEMRKFRAAIAKAKKEESSKSSECSSIPNNRVNAV